MLPTLIALRRLLTALGRALADPATRGLVAVTFVILAVGTAFYSGVEGWSVLDSLYFSVVTLTTIGFGDLVPDSDLAKGFTIVYSLVGIGVLASFVTSLAIFARADWEARTPHLPRLRHRRRGASNDEDTSGDTARDDG